jgi:hypothetical protein
MRRASEILFEQAVSMSKGLTEEIDRQRGKPYFDNLNTFMDARIGLIKDLLLAIEQIEKAGSK